MSGFTPFVSSSPPPFDDTEVEQKDDDDFSDFASAVIITSATTSSLGKSSVETIRFQSPIEVDAYHFKVVKTPGSSGDMVETEDHFEAMGENSDEEGECNAASCPRDSVEGFSQVTCEENSIEHISYGEHEVYKDVTGKQTPGDGEEDLTDACAEVVNVLCGFDSSRFTSEYTGADSPGMDSMAVNADLESRDDSMMGEDFDDFQSVDVENEAGVSDEENEFLDDGKEVFTDYKKVGDPGCIDFMPEVDTDDFEEFHTAEEKSERNDEKCHELDEKRFEFDDRDSPDDLSPDNLGQDYFKPFKSDINIDSSVDSPNDSSLPDIQLRMSTFDNDEEFYDFTTSVVCSIVPDSALGDDNFDDYNTAAPCFVSNVDADGNEFDNFSAAPVCGIPNSNVDIQFSESTGMVGDDFVCSAIADNDQLESNIGDNVDDDDFDDFSAAVRCDVAKAIPDASFFAKDIGNDDDVDDFDDFQNAVEHEEGLQKSSSNIDEPSNSKAKAVSSSDGDNAWATFEVTPDNLECVDTPKESAHSVSTFSTFSGQALTTSTKQDENEMDEFGQFSNSNTTGIPQMKHSSRAAVLTSCFPFTQKDISVGGSDNLNGRLLLDLISQVVKCSTSVRDGQSKSSHPKSYEDRVSLDGSVWNNLKSMEHTAALKFQWPNSCISRALLHSINIDTRKVLVGHKKLSMPIFASNLGLLEPKKAVMEPQKSPTKEGNLNISKPTTPGGMTSNEFLQVEFDWQGSGLTNPLDASEKEKELLEALGSATSEPQKTLSLETILASMSFVPSTQNIVTRPKDDGRKLSKEALTVLNKLPDLSFMQAKVLMFPLKGEMTVN